MAPYEETALRARKKVLKMIYEGQSSHIGSNFSCIDILTVLHSVMKPEDILIYSKGWVAASAYFFLAEMGIIPKTDLNTYCQEGSKYIGLTEPNITGIHFAGGSMQMGLPAGVGFALAKKLKKEKGNVYVLMSDGELAGGMVWESASIAKHHKLNNLVALVDNNEFQAMGKSEEILNMEPLREKWKAFGWEVAKADGHNFKKIEASLTWPRLMADTPKIILFKTVKGKGVSFMEADNLYHYKNLSKEEYVNALKELK